ncbi:Putative ribonuclease H protein At1g65750 [Linum grandiflorum]
MLLENKLQRSECLVGWTPRLDVEVIVNTDGLVLQPSGRAAGGGILQTTSGIYKAAFVANFCVCTIILAELRAPLHGLHIAWDLGYRRVNLQVDSAVVVSFLCHNGAVDPRHQICVDELKQLIARD